MGKNQLATLPDEEFDADELAASIVEEEEELRAQALAEKPKKERKPRKQKLADEIEQSAAFEERVSLTAGAFTATGAALVEAANLQPPFTEEHGRVLAAAWVPVLDYYTGESENPLVPALITTGIVMMPYLYQVMQRGAEAKKRAAAEEAANVQS